MSPGPNDNLTGGGPAASRQFSDETESPHVTANRLPSSLVAALLLAWALRWGTGPVVSLLALPMLAHVPRVSGWGDASVPVQLLSAVLGLGVAAATLVLGAALLAVPHRAQRWVVPLLRLVICYQVLFVVGVAVPEVCLGLTNRLAMVYKGSQSVFALALAAGDVGCALVLLRQFRPAPTTPRTILAPAPVLVLAVWVVFLREGLGLVTLTNQGETILRSLATASPNWPFISTVALRVCLGLVGLGALVALGLRSSWTPGVAVVGLALGLAKTAVALMLPLAQAGPHGAMGLAMAVSLAAATASSLVEYAALLTSLLVRSGVRVGAGPTTG